MPVGDITLHYVKGGHPEGGHQISHGQPLPPSLIICRNLPKSRPPSLITTNNNNNNNNLLEKTQNIIQLF